MERGKVKEAGRKKLVRERADTLKNRPSRKTPAKEVIRQTGRYQAIETAKKQFIEVRQAFAPDQEQPPYTAVDKAESYSVNAAHESYRLLRKNAGHLTEIMRFTMKRIPR